METNVLLSIQNLYTYFYYDEGTVRAVDGITFNVFKGETLGIVGESGCGKSVTALSILKLIKCPPGKITADIINLETSNGQILDISQLKQGGKKIRALRGKDIAMIFQEPMTALTPVYSIGQHILEMLFSHNRGMSKKEAKKKAIELIKMVGIPNPEDRFYSYPHELSGGLRQRGMIAMALSCSPRLLICDEPTTALDVTVQAQILELLKDLQKKLDMSMIMITHNLGVVSEVCDRIVVMYLGQIVERGSVRDILRNPLHPYTKGLLKSTPLLGKRAKEKLVPIRGSVPSMLDLPEGCRFRERCDHAREVCKKPVTEYEIEPGHSTLCWLYEDRKGSESIE